MQSKIKLVYVITKRDDKSFWNRIGIAFVNRDGSLNVKLDSVPVNGEMQIRDYVPREESLSSLRDVSAENGNGSGDLITELA